MRYASHLADLVGNTPLVRLNDVAAGTRATVLAKVEYLNPGGSAKDRIAARIIDAAEASGQLRPGGTIANVGVHGTPVELPMQDMWISNVTLTMGLVDTVSIPTLLKMVASGRIPAEKMGTHSFTFDQIDEAYDVFANAAANQALKVVIMP